MKMLDKICVSDFKNQRFIKKLVKRRMFYELRKYFRSTDFFTHSITPGDTFEIVYEIKFNRDIK